MGFLQTMYYITRTEGCKKSEKSINLEGGFFKIGKRDFMFIREWRVHVESI